MKNFRSTCTQRCFPRSHLCDNNAIYSSFEKLIIFMGELKSSQNRDWTELCSNRSFRCLEKFMNVLIAALNTQLSWVEVLFISRVVFRVLIYSQSFVYSFSGSFGCVLSAKFLHNVTYSGWANSLSSPERSRFLTGCQVL